MNAIAFGTKRAFHGFLRVSRNVLATVGLTAARFDMMHALLNESRRGGYSPPVLQDALRRELGVTAGVVSRMLHALEELGLVTREQAHDRRRRWIRLTEKGKECIRQARRLLLCGMRRIVWDAICFGRHRDPQERFIHMEQLEGYLRALRRDFGDIATLYYPWGHPDD
jgi:DNA-binding MarR family transcriptional regulator